MDAVETQETWFGPTADDDLNANISEKSTEDKKVNFSVYFCLLVVGIGVLLPFNFLITPELFWQEKFASRDEDGNIVDDEINWMQNFWQNFLALVMCGTTMIISFAMPTLEDKCCSLRALSYTSIFSMCILFIPIAATATIDTYSWIVGYFSLNLIISCLITIFSTILQAALINHAGNMPSVYMEAVFSGQAMAGVISSVAAIIATVATDNQESSALCFFIIAAVISLLVAVAYYKLFTNPTFVAMQKNPYLNDSEEVDEFSSKKGVLVKLLWIELLAGFIIPFVTLSVFPGLVVQVRSNSGNETWAYYFISIVTFLFFNVFDYVGRLLTNFLIIWKVRSGVGCLLYSCLRFGFLIVFPYCNVSGKSDKIPTIFGDDWMYALWIIFFALTNGYLTSTIFMIVPERLKELKRSNTDISSGSYLIFMTYAIGLVSGSGAAFAVKHVVTSL